MDNSELKQWATDNNVKVEAAPPADRNFGFHASIRDRDLDGYGYTPIDAVKELWRNAETQTYRLNQLAAWETS